MKINLIILFSLATIICYSQEFKLLEINAKWNAKNSLPIKKLGGIKIDFAWLENQSEDFKKEIKSVPVLVLIKDKKPIYQWSAGIDFKLKVTEKEFLKIFNKLNNR
jgi:hypothetical protein